MSKIWKYTNGCAKQYRCSLAIHSMSVLSYSYVIITDYEINAPVNGKNVLDGLNEIDNRYFK